MGRYALATAAYEKAGNRPRLARVYIRSGRRSEATQLIEDLKAQPKGLPLGSGAAIYIALGDKDEAFRLLLRLVDEHSDFSIFIKEDPPFDTLHDDPRWKALLRRMNFPPPDDSTRTY